MSFTGYKHVSVCPLLVTMSEYVCKIKCRTDMHVYEFNRFIMYSVVTNPLGFLSRFLLANQTVSYLIIRCNHFSGIGLVDKSTAHSFAYGVK